MDLCLSMAGELQEPNIALGEIALCGGILSLAIDVIGGQDIAVNEVPRDHVSDPFPWLGYLT